jgi:hypothetical protein
MARILSAYRQLFGAQFPAELASPINARSLIANNAKRSQHDPKLLSPPRELVAEERARRMTLLNNLLGLSSDATRDELAEAVFEGLRVVDEDPSYYHHDEVLQMLVRTALGDRDINAAKGVAKRKDVARPYRSILRDFQRTNTYGAVRTGRLDRAHLALIQSGLLDPLTALGHEYPNLKVYYRVQYDKGGIPREIGPLQSSIALAFAAGTKSRTLQSMRDLPAAAVEEVMDQAIGDALILDVADGKGGPRIKSALENVGLAGVKLVFPDANLKNLPIPTVFVLESDIPRAVLTAINHHLSAKLTRSR